MQQITLNSGNGPQQLPSQGNFTLSQAPRQYCVTSSSSLQNQLQQLTSSGSTFSITPVSGSSSGLVQNQNIVQVQVSSAAGGPPTLLHQHQQQVLNRADGNTNNGMWNSYAAAGGAGPPNNTNPNVVNVNLNGSAGSARILTQPGQHPVISIPDTTQNGGGGGGGGNGGTNGGLVGGDFDLFSAIASVGGGTGESSNSNSSSGVKGNNGNNNNRPEFQDDGGQNNIVLGNGGGNCVCDLRAMLMCRKCGAFCHDDCMRSADLCMTCAI